MGTNVQWITYHIIVLDLKCLVFDVSYARSTHSQHFSCWLFCFSFSHTMSSVDRLITTSQKKGVINKKRINQKDKIDCNKDFGSQILSGIYQVDGGDEKKHQRAGQLTRSFMHYFCFFCFITAQLDRKQTSHLVKLFCYASMYNKPVCENQRESWQTYN